MNVVKLAEDRQGDQFHDEQQEERRHGFSQEDGPSGSRGGDQDIQAVVGEFAGKAAVDDQGAGEGEDQPEHAARDRIEFFTPQVEREAEQDQDDERETGTCVDGLLGAEFGLEVFLRDGECGNQASFHA